MLDALADGEDIGLGRLHVVVDDDAAIDGEAGLDARGRRWAGCRRQPRRRRHRDSCRPRAPHPPHDRCRGSAVVVRPSRTRMPRSSILPDEVLAAVRIELALHQRRHQVHDRDVAALHLQATRRLEPEQAAADDHGLRAGPRPPQELARVVQRPERRRRRPCRARRSAETRRELPVASSSVSYGVTLPSSPVTVFASASTSTMRTPTRRSMSCCAIPLGRSAARCRRPPSRRRAPTTA